MTLTEQNTHWLYVWIANDPDYYDDAMDAAGQGAEELKEVMINALANSEPGTGAHYTAIEMTDDDFETVDWEDIRDTLLN